MVIYHEDTTLIFNRIWSLTASDVRVALREIEMEKGRVTSLKFTKCQLINLAGLSNHQEIATVDIQGALNVVHVDASIQITLNKVRWASNLKARKVKVEGARKVSRVKAVAVDLEARHVEDIETQSGKIEAETRKNIKIGSQESTIDPEEATPQQQVGQASPPAVLPPAAETEAAKKWWQVPLGIFTDKPQPGEGRNQPSDQVNLRRTDHFDVVPPFKNVTTNSTKPDDRQNQDPEPPNQLA